MKKSAISVLLLSAFCLSLLSGYGQQIEPTTQKSPSPAVSVATSLTPPSPSLPVDTEVPQPSAPQSTEISSLRPFDDLYMMFNVSSRESGSCNMTFAENQYVKKDLYTYCFDNTTVFSGGEYLASQILEAGKNPGLGIRGLHTKGITGQGVNVAIIDQNLVGKHSEYEGKVVAYYDSGCEQPENSGSYHGASVLSILAGETLGVAPGAKVYYAAAPSWHKDSAYFADSLYWIIEQNKLLPESEKIRLVSVSSAPEDGWYLNGEQWTKAVEAAEEAGMLVLDCRSSAPTGFVFSAYYDPDDPESVEKCRPFYPDGEYDHIYKDEERLAYFREEIILAPASYRTVAQEFIAGKDFYRYDGIGGQSWAVPYVAGVLALGFQVRPELSANTMKELLFASSYADGDGLRIINPPAFIECVQMHKEND